MSWKVPGGKILKNIIIDQESTRSLEQEIHRTLSPMENKVLKYYLKGYGYIQIAKIMGKTPKSIDNALQRIRGKIRNFSLSFWDKNSIIILIFVTKNKLLYERSRVLWQN